MKLETESHPYPDNIGWIKKGPSMKVMGPYHVLISIGKFYQDSVAYDVVDMNACHVLLGRPWQHNVDATHRGKRNICMFTWEGKRIAMKPIPPVPKPPKAEKPKFLFICNRGEFLMEAKEKK